MILKTLVFLISLFTIFQAKADITSTDLTETVIPSVGYRFGAINTYEFCMGYGGSVVTEEKRNFNIIAGHILVKAGFEFNSEKSYYAPKLGVELNAFFLSARLVMMHEFMKYENQLTVLPEVGICLGSYANCMIRFTGLDDKSYPTFSANQIQLNINIPISLNK